MGAIGYALHALPHHVYAAIAAQWQRDRDARQGRAVYRKAQGHPRSSTQMKLLRIFSDQDGGEMVRRMSEQWVITRKSVVWDRTSSIFHHRDVHIGN